MFSRYFNSTASIARLALLSLVVLIASAFPLQSGAAEYDFIVDDLFYKITGEQTVMLTRPIKTGYDKLKGEVNIPATVEHDGKTYRVTSMRYGVFSRSGITAVTIPGTISQVSREAFYDCYNLASVSLPASINAIGSSAFEFCTKLTELDLPETVSTIGWSAFESSGLVTLSLPPSLATVARRLCYSCSNLKQVVLPEQVRVIDEEAFLGCPALTSIEIPSSVDSIGYKAFYSCSSLADIAMPDKFVRLGTSVFDGTAWLKNQPDGLIYLGKAAYRFKGSLPEGARVEVRDGISHIAGNCFYGCNWLRELVLPGSLLSIGDRALEGCSGLQSIDIPASVIEIGSCAFEGCSSLRSAVIPAGVTKLESCLFRDCSGLESVSIPPTVTRFGGLVFAGCSSLKDFTLPPTLTDIGESAFQCCSSLESVVLPNSVTTIGEGIFAGCSALTHCILPRSITAIGRGFFGGCSSLSAINLPPSVTAIGIGAFNGCVSLESLELPPLVTSIGAYAFACTPLTELQIPPMVSEIGRAAFEGCDNLRQLRCLSTRPPLAYEFYEEYLEMYYETDTIQHPGTFDGMDKQNCIVYVPEEAFSKYRSAKGWREFKKLTKLELRDITGDVTGDGVVDIADLNQLLNNMLGDVTVEVNGAKMGMVNVDGGTFNMGSNYDFMGFYASPYPQHKVTLDGFMISTTEVTQEFYAAVLYGTPIESDDLYPKYDISWQDCQTFLTRLSQLTGQPFRLPTEAEWEFAARGGNKSQGFRYSGSNDYTACGWCIDTSMGYGKPLGPWGVAHRKPNELGLYDMSGNVWEWCQDWFDVYPSEPQVNPRGPETGVERVIRGGSCYSYGEWLSEVVSRAACPPGEKRLQAGQDEPIGMRLVLDGGLKVYSKSCDVNSDGVVDIADVNSVINVMLEK